MIPARNKELFIERIALGDTFEEACLASQISVPSMFRFLKTDEILKKKYDSVLFEAKEKKRVQATDEGLAKIKELVLKRKR